MNNPIGWFEIHVDDMARARAFYQGMLGAELTRLENPATVAKTIEMWAFPMDQAGYGASGSLVRMPGFAAGGNSTLVYFSCADCAVEAARALQHGGKIHEGKTSLGPYGYMALVIDTEGNMIGLHSMQ
jgi:predicted enzyme related to lactoylglutathione lyase